MYTENMDYRYIAIDLKSFYASVECIDRGLDPMTTRLVVADESRTEKTICLAVSPALKAYGIPGRPRLFQVTSKAKALGIDFMTAPPRMARYIEVSTEIYKVYMKYVSPEDVHVYSIDEVFIDAGKYFEIYGMTAEELATAIMKDVLKTTGITATVGIGTNLYLCKIAMDIVAKHKDADENGVRLAALDEMSYRKLLWNHRPITDFWRIGRGYARRLESVGLFTMGDIARCSLGGEKDYYNEDLLYSLFGINAELLIDHAWGWEPCTIEDIKSYRPSVNSICSGQVLQRPYSSEEGRMVISEMADDLALDLLDKGLVTDQLVLTVGYDIENLADPAARAAYKGEITTDAYGRKVPKHAHGTSTLERSTSSSRMIIEAAVNLYDRIINSSLLIRRISLTANHVVNEEESLVQIPQEEQLSFFVDYKEREQRLQEEEEMLNEERCVQETLLNIKKKFGKNAILRGSSYREGATAKERNSRIGGHKA